MVLSGVRAVTLHDPATVCLADLSAQFYLNEADVGKNRAEACSSKLQDLNYSVQVSSATGLLTPEFISQFQVSVNSLCCRYLPFPDRHTSSLGLAGGIGHRFELGGLSKDQRLLSQTEHSFYSSGG